VYLLKQGKQKRPDKGLSQRFLFKVFLLLRQLSPAKKMVLYVVMNSTVMVEIIPP
jgi:hypothetical protein